MTILPIKGLGNVGLITDQPTWELPPNGFTAARNIRFSNNTISRGPAFRTAFTLPTDHYPIYATSYYAPDGHDRIILAGKRGRLSAFLNNAVSDVSNAEHTDDTPNNRPYSSCYLSGILYVTRKGAVPKKLIPSASTFALLDHWPDTWTCRAFRSFRGLLLAINTTEGATAYDKRFRWSEFAEGVNEPSTWDASLTTANAGFNDLLELEWPLVDGCQLRDYFVLYTQSEAVLLEMVEDSRVFNVRPLFQNCGVLSLNCVVEVDGKHVVFGPKDIIVHDGNTQAYPAKGRVHDYIYSGINLSKADVAFVVHNRTSHEVWFCYNSMRQNKLQWPGKDLANEAAVWNYKDDTWTNYDLPNVGRPAFGNLTQLQTWDSIDYSWDSLPATWDSQEDDLNRSLIFPSMPLDPYFTQAKMLVIDNYYWNARHSFPVEDAYAAPAFGERLGIDLDEYAAEVRGYKFVRAVYPQALKGGDGAILCGFSAALTMQSNYQRQGPVEWPPETSYKVDVKLGGRLIGYDFTCTGKADFNFSSVEFDVVTLGRGGKSGG